MDIITALGTGLVLGLSAGIAPGPMLALVITQTMKFGVKEGLKVALSPLVTDFPIICISLLIISRIAEFHFFLGMVSLVGGGYILLLAYECFRTGNIDPFTSAGQPRSLRKGITINFLNPHPYVFWITIGSPLTLKYNESGIIYSAAFLAIFYLFLVGSKMALAVIVGKSRCFLEGRLYFVIMYILGALLAGFSIFLFKDAYRYLFSG